MKFQSTLPQGEWRYLWYLLGYTQEFQSTLPQGEWQRTVWQLRHVIYFNPHSHKGSDDAEGSCDRICAISIHTPTRGVTGLYLSNGNVYIFQSTLPQGEWRFCKKHICRLNMISIHTPTRGVTKTSISSFALLKFQSTLPQGEWRWYIRLSDSIYSISIHTPTRGVTQFHSLLKRRFSLFQSTLPQGEWQYTHFAGVYLLYFNPHSHKGSDRITLILRR